MAALGVPGHPGCQGLARDPPARSSQPIHHQLLALPAPSQLGPVQSHSLKVKHLFQLPEPSTSSQPAIAGSQDLWWPKDWGCQTLDYLGMSFFHTPVNPRECFCLSQIPLHCGCASPSPPSSPLPARLILLLPFFPQISWRTAVSCGKPAGGRGDPSVLCMGMILKSPQVLGDPQEDVQCVNEGS